MQEEVEEEEKKRERGSGGDEYNIESEAHTMMTIL